MGGGFPCCFLFAGFVLDIERIRILINYRGLKRVIRLRLETLTHYYLVLAMGMTLISRNKTTMTWQVLRIHVLYSIV